MSKLYISKIDHKTFTSEDELMNHLKSNYTMVDESGGEATVIHEKLQLAFPFADIIDVSDSDSPEYGKYFVSMRWGKYNGEFNCYIGESKDNNYYYMSFDDVDSAINYYKLFIHEADEITDKLMARYSPKKVSVEQMYEGDMNSDNSILFRIDIGDKTYSEHYEFKCVEDFVNSFKGYFETTFEGEVIIEKDYSCGYDKEPKINGVSVKTILGRAKKVRIEILELR